MPPTTPSYSPEYGMAEAFVNTPKRDHVYVADLWNAEAVLAKLLNWIDDYNDPPQGA